MDQAAIKGIIVSIAIGFATACGSESPQPYGLPFAGTLGSSGSNAIQQAIGTGGTTFANGGTLAVVGGTLASGGRSTIGTAGKATGGTPAGGKGGSTTTAKGGTGGSTPTGGKGGSTTATAGKGGAAGSGKGGAGGSGATSSMFTEAYDSSCVGPGGSRYGTNHFPSTDCLSCHRTRRPAMVYGGTVFQSDGSSGARNVEIGVKSGTKVYSTCTSSAGGLFYAPSETGTINWTGAEVAIRNAKGEKSTMHTGLTLSGSCNAGGNCHGVDKLIAP